MRTELENSYKRDYKRALSQGIITDLVLLEIDKITQSILLGKPLPPKYKDHPLKGDYAGYRDCHIKFDLVLVYRVQDDTLYLSRIGRHSDIFK